MFLIKIIDDFFKRLSTIEYTIHLFIFIPIFATCIRVGQEELMFGFDAASPHLILNYLVGYLLLQMMVILVLNVGIGWDFRKLAGLASVGLILAAVPAIIDYILPVQPDRKYCYFFEFHWNFAASYQLIGETITLWFSIFGVTLFAAWATRKVTRALLSGALIYIVLQFYGWRWFALTEQNTMSPEFQLLELMTLLGIILIISLYILFNRKSMFPSLVRFNHALPWGLITAAGSRLMGEHWFISLIKGLVMSLAFQLVVFANDYFDRDQDAKHGGSARPVEREDMIFMSYIMGLLLLWMLIFHEYGFFLLLLFFALWTSYHLPPLRFKRIFCINYFFEGMSGVACFLFGVIPINYYNSGEIQYSKSTGIFAGGEWISIFTVLILGGYSLGSMFKDYKDIEQDKAEGIGTIYTFLLKKGMSLKTINLFVSLITSITSIVAPIWLLIIGTPILPVIVLLILAIIPCILLNTIKDRKTAVEATIWSIVIYLLLLVKHLPILSLIKK